MKQVSEMEEVGYGGSLGDVSRRRGFYGHHLTDVGRVVFGHPGQSPIAGGASIRCFSSAMKFPGLDHQFL